MYVEVSSYFPLTVKNSSIRISGRELISSSWFNCFLFLKYYLLAITESVVFLSSPLGWPHFHGFFTQTPMLHK